MTLTLPEVTLGGANRNFVLRATVTVIPPTYNTPNKQIYCKTNVFLMISMSSRGAVGDSFRLFGTPFDLLWFVFATVWTLCRKLLIFHWFYNVFWSVAWSTWSRHKEQVVVKRFEYVQNVPKWGPKKRLPAPLDYHKIIEKPLVL